jgi:hypothetical protein
MVKVKRKYTPGMNLLSRFGKSILTRQATRSARIETPADSFAGDKQSGVGAEAPGVPTTEPAIQDARIFLLAVNQCLLGFFAGCTSNVKADVAQFFSEEE